MKKLLYFSLFIFSFSLCEGQAWLWGRQSIGTITQAAECYGQATDTNGNVYITGEFIDTLFFGTQKIISDNAGDMYIAKFDKNGNVLWVTEGNKTRKNWGDMAIGNWLTLDDSGNVIVTGQFIGIMVFGHDTVKVPNGDYSTFTVKYNSSGSELWATGGKDKTYSDRSYGQSVCTDKNGNVFVSGIFSDTVTFGTKQLVSKGTDLFILKYNPRGNIIWATQSNVPSAAIPQYFRMACATDPVGHVFLAGTYKDTLPFGTDTLIMPRYTDQQAYLLKFDTNGSILWAQSSRTGKFNSWVEAYGMAVDATGNPVICGGYYGDTTWFGTKKVFRPFYYLAKYNNNGQCIWAEAMADTATTYGCSIATDNRNNIYATGAQWGYTTNVSSVKYILGGDTVSSNRVSEPGFIYMLDSNGKGLCGSIMANTRPYLGNTVSPSGNYIYCASCADTTTVSSIFGSDTLTNSGFIYPFIASWQSCSSITGLLLQPAAANTAINVFPNPSGGIFTIHIVGAQNFVPSTVEIYNVLGENVLTGALHSAQGDNLIDIDNQPNGVYFYRVLSGNGALIGEGKLIIQK